MRFLVYAAGTYAFAASAAEAFSFAPVMPSQLVLRSSLPLATSKLATVARPQRKMGARLASLNMILAQTVPDFATILQKKVANDPALFQKTYDMIIVGSGPIALTASLSAVAQGRSVIIVDGTPADSIPFDSCVYNSRLGKGTLRGTDCWTLTFRHALAEVSTSYDFDELDTDGASTIAKTKLEAGLKKAGWSPADVSKLLADISSDQVSREQFLLARNTAAAQDPGLGIRSRKDVEWTNVKSRLNNILASNHVDNTGTMDARKIPHVRGSGMVTGREDDLWNVHVKGLGGAGDGILKARKVLLATGSRNTPVDNVPYDVERGVFDGDTVKKLDYFPLEMTIVGNQLTSCEYARSFAALGTKVTLLIPSRQIFNQGLTRAKAEAAGERLFQQLKKSGVDVQFDDSIADIKNSENPAKDPVTIKMTSGKTIKTNALLTLLGRKPNVDHLGLDKNEVGVALNTEGSILVDQNLETTSFGIYAAGDVVSDVVGLEDVHGAIKKMFGLSNTFQSSSERDMSSRHADFLSSSFNSAGYASKLHETFPGVIDERTFIETMTDVVGMHGFTSESSINLVSTCRDEICKPFTETLDSIWGQHFSISSLAGFVFCGRTGFGAGMAHAPICDGKERYVFWVMPHIAFGIQHIAGRVYRPGRAGPSSACGALLALQGEIQNAGGVGTSVAMDPDDTEMSLVRQGVMNQLEPGQMPDLVDITYAAHKCIVDQVKRTAESVVDPDKCEYVIISGIQIHGPLNKNFIYPGSITKYVSGVETDLTNDYQTSIKDYKLNEWIQSEASLDASAKSGRLPSLFSDIKL